MGIEETSEHSTIASLDKYRAEQAARREVFIRPSQDEDLENRKYVSTEFIQKIGQLPENIPFRFHGTPVYELEAILDSGSITSGADRTDSHTSFDNKGRISVTTSKNIEETVGSESSYKLAKRLQSEGKKANAGYISIADHEVPFGCTFVLLPQTSEEARLGENGGNTMKNVELNSKQFRALLVSDEFKLPAIKLLESRGFDSDKCKTYHEFIDSVDQEILTANDDYPYVNTYKPEKNSSNFVIDIS